MTKFGLPLVALALMGLILWMACSKKDSPTPPDPQQIEQPIPEIDPVPKEEEGTGYQEPEEVPEPTTYDEAIKASEITGKKVIVYFTAPSWCPPCQRMESQTLPDPKVQEVLKSYIFYKIDIDKEEKSIASKWKVRGVPTYVVTNSEEKLLKSGSGFKSPSQFVQWIGKAESGQVMYFKEGSWKYRSY